MPDYEIWLADETNRIRETHNVMTADDLSALAAALSLGPAHMIEIWRDGRYVMTVRKGEMPLNLVWAGLA